jgi:DNA-binding response OmpR family regulator
VKSRSRESTDVRIRRANDCPTPFFGLRKIAPRACIADKPHLQDFFCEALEDLGFVTCKYERQSGIPSLVGEYQPDLFVLGLSIGGAEAAHVLEALAVAQYQGRVLIVGAPASPMADAEQGLGAELGLNMLPLLATPFSHEALRAILSELLPREGRPIRSSTWRRRCTRTGSSCGISRRSRSAVSPCAEPKR